MNEEKLLHIAHDAANAAEKVHREYAEIGFTSSAKEDHYNMVTSADIDSEKAIIEVIRNSFPDHNIIAEEGKYEDSDSSYTWIIDPLDGTNNFFKGLPHYAVSIAVMKNDTALAGVVKNTAKDEVFSAIRGGGAYCGGRRITVSTQDSFSNAMLFTGFHYDRGENMQMTLTIIGRLFKKGIIGIRRTGSAALDLCYIAAGWGDAFWEHVLSPWDYAAGTLIIQEAGGRVSDFAGNPPVREESTIIASNGLIHEMLRDEVSGMYAGG